MQFVRTTSLSLWPKYILKSHLGSPLQVLLQGGSATGAATNIVSVGPNESLPLWKFDGEGRKGLRVGIPNDADFSSWIPIDKPGSYHTNLYAATSAAERQVLAILAVHVERRSEGWHLVRVLDSRHHPPIRVENRSLTSTLVVQQKGCDWAVFTLRPGQFQSLAWPSLVAPRRLVVQCRLCDADRAQSTQAAPFTSDVGSEAAEGSDFSTGSASERPPIMAEYDLDQLGCCEGLPISDRSAKLRATITALTGTKILAFTECETASLCDVESFGDARLFGSRQWSVVVPAIVATVVNDQAESVMKLICRSLSAEMCPRLGSRWIDFAFTVGRVSAVDVRTSVGRRLIDTRPSMMHSEDEPTADWLKLRCACTTAARAVHLGSVVCDVDALCWHIDWAFARELSKVFLPRIESAAPEAALSRMLRFNVEVGPLDEWWIFVEDSTIGEFRMKITLADQQPVCTLTLSELVIRKQWHTSWAALLEFLRRGYSLRFWTQCNAADPGLSQLLYDLDLLLEL